MSILPASSPKFTGYSIHFITRFASLQSTLHYIFHSISSLHLFIPRCLSLLPFLFLSSSTSLHFHWHTSVYENWYQALTHPVPSHFQLSSFAHFLSRSSCLPLSLILLQLPRSKVLIISWNVVNHGISFVLFPFDFQLNFSFEFSC